MIQLTIHHVLFQAVFRNTVAQHTAGLGLHVEDFAVVTLESQIVGTGETGRASTYDGNFLAGRGVLHERDRRIEQTGLGGMTVHTADSDLFLNQCAAAGFLAGSRAGEPKNIGER